MTTPLSPTKGSLYPIVVLLGASVLWGLTWLPLKHFAAQGLHGITVALVSHGALCVPAIPWLVTRRAQFRDQLTAMLVVALLGGCANLSFVTAVASGDVVRVMVLFYLLPAWGVLGGRIVLGEAIDARRGLSVVFALLGAFFVLGGLSVLESPPTPIDALAAVSGAAFAAQNVAFRKFETLGTSFKIAAVWVGCFACAGVLSVLGMAKLPAVVAPSVLPQVMAFGLVWLLLASIGSLWGIANMEAGKSSILIIMELVAAVVSAALLSGRSLNALEWLGGALILLAAVLEAWRPSRVV